jgi:hypothetical protein
MNDLIAEVNSGSDPREEIKRYKAAPTVTDLWFEYEKSMRLRKNPKSDKSLREERQRFDKHIVPVIGHLRVEDVKPFHLSEILQRLAA